MTIEEIKAKLKRYRFIAGEIEDLLDEKERLRSLAEKMTPSLSHAPVHGGDGDKMTSAIARIVEVERYIEKRSKELLRVRMDAEELIFLVDDQIIRNIMHKKYFLNKSWKDISKEVHFSIVHCKRQNKSGIDEIFKKMIRNDT